MEGIGIILSALALVVSLAALWFASDLARRVEAESREFYEAHIKALRESVESEAKAVRTLQKRVAGMDGALETVAALGKTVEAQQTSVAALSEQMEMMAHQSAPRAADPRRR